jgi:mRNA interferase MazF
MRFKRGDVVLIRFPYADLVRWGKRPALVIQDESVVSELGHYVLAQVTSTQREGPTRVTVTKDSPAGVAMGLLMDSTVLLDVIQTTEAALIERRIGSCPKMGQVDLALRKLLHL